MALDREMVHALVGERDVPAGSIVVDVREAHLQPVGVGEEAALGPGVRHLEIGAETRPHVAQRQGCVPLAAGGVAQRTVHQWNPVGIVFDLVRGYLVVGVIGAGQVQLPVEVLLTALQTGGKARGQVVTAAEEAHAAFERIHRKVIRIEAEHAADGIGAVLQGAGALDDLHTVHGELIHLQTVVVSPLLSLVLDAVHGDGNAVEAESADGGLGLAGADGARLHAGNGAQTLGERG